MKRQVEFEPSFHLSAELQDPTVALAADQIVPAVASNVITMMQRLLPDLPALRIPECIVEHRHFPEDDVAAMADYDVDGKARVVFNQREPLAGLTGMVPMPEVSNWLDTPLDRGASVKSLEFGARGDHELDYVRTEALREPRRVTRRDYIARFALHEAAHLVPVVVRALGEEGGHGETWRKMTETFFRALHLTATECEHRVP